ncbi:MAG: UDP-2,4-diacetamido-2,4,6-trideoxy-beta-L-altropyranose hydrolase [Roseburia sp.]|nr:UDP-2,4-diacetamido-2,4,6-trideoxy-beta-L-altropyranose hydrolase [Roseburia sp.]
MLYIRADGNTDIGMGHVMRCLSVAEAACVLPGGRPTFLLADEACASMIADRGFAVRVLCTDYREPESELPMLAALLQREDVLLVDSYQARPAYYRALRQRCGVACMEDMGHPYPVNLLINYNLYAPKLKEAYRQGAADALPDRLLLGAAYTPLRTDFQTDTNYAVQDNVTDVMITTGGSDPHFASGALLERLTERDMGTEIRYHVVIGPFNRFAGELRLRYGDCEAVRLHENVRDMKALMRACDVVITATGSTLYEVSALGVPMICFYFAENQRQGAEALAALTDIVNAGCFAGRREETVERIAQALLRCVRDKAYRQTLYRQERQLVDGAGAARIAEAVLCLAQEKRHGE